MQGCKQQYECVNIYGLLQGWGKHKQDCILNLWTLIWSPMWPKMPLGNPVKERLLNLCRVPCDSCVTTSLFQRKVLKLGLAKGPWPGKLR